MLFLKELGHVRAPGDSRVMLPRAPYCDQSPVEYQVAEGYFSVATSHIVTKVTARSMLIIIIILYHCQS